MTDTTQEVETTTNEPQVNTDEPTLDDLYKEAGLEQPAPQVQTQQQQVQQPQQEVPVKEEIPDPFDVENFKAFIAKQQSDLVATKKSQEAFVNAIKAEQQKAFVAKLEDDIKQAADYVAKESGIENNNLATFELNERARTDAKFKALWESRDSSPQAKAAFTKALAVVSREIGKKYEIKTDPQLVANRKALAASRQSSATTSQEEGNEPAWASATGAEFQMNWERLVRNNN